MTSLGSNTELRAAKRKIRFDLQDSAHRLVWANAPIDPETKKRKRNRFTACCKVVAPHLENASIQYSEELERARYSGTIKCNNAFCPVCAPLKAEIASRTLDRAIEAAYVAGFETQHIIYTMRHSLSEAFLDVKGTFSSAQQSMRRSRRFRSIKAKYGWVESVRNVEVTDGENGYHYHRHEVVATRSLSSEERRAFEDELWLCWHHHLALAGGDADKAHGLVVRSGDSAKKALAEYFNKFDHLPDPKNMGKYREGWGTADEATRHVSKVGKSRGGRTPMQLLADFHEGDSRSGARWNEIFEGMKGTQFLTGLKKFCAAFGVDSDEIREAVADEQAAEWGDLFSDVLEVDQDVMTSLSRKRERAGLLNLVEKYQGNVYKTRRAIWELTGLRPVAPTPLIASDGRILAYVNTTNVPRPASRWETSQKSTQDTSRLKVRRVLREIGGSLSRGSTSVGEPTRENGGESRQSHANEDGSNAVRGPGEVATGCGYHKAIAERRKKRVSERLVTCGGVKSAIENEALHDG